jgi:hypothetical protein
LPIDSVSQHGGTFSHETGISDIVETLADAEEYVRGIVGSFIARSLLNISSANALPCGAGVVEAARRGS